MMSNNKEIEIKAFSRIIKIIYHKLLKQMGHDSNGIQY
mgnify:CR=1 FL=1